MQFKRRSVEVDTPELGKVQVRDVSMMLGIEFANAVAVIPDEEFSFFHHSLVPLYKQMIVECVLKQGTNSPVFANGDADAVEELSFDTFSLLVKTLRRTMLEDQQTDVDETKKN